MRRRTFAVMLVFAALSSISPSAAIGAQDANPRYGKWRLRSTDAEKPSNNVMTYEPHQGKGMKITINTLNADGTLTPQWGYTTMFDGKDEPMTGFLNSAANTNALSELSIASMGDLGYGVELGSGDNYHLPRPPRADVAAKVAAGQVRDLQLARHERLLRPVARVE